VPEPERFFFVHLNRTGGTALLRRLRAQFPPEAIYPGPGDGEPPTSTISVDHFLERWATRGSEIRLVAAHFPMAVTDRVGVAFRTFTLLRDPVERTISNLGHYRQVTPEAQGRSLEAIYAEPLRFDVVHNHMVKMFSLTPAEMTNGMLTSVTFTPERLQRAKDRLAGVDVIGLQSGFAAFCAELEARFGWTLGPDGFMNRTLEAIEVSDAFRAQIARDNADDVELYRFGCELLAQRRR
jgi:hypothetical protein